MRYLIGFFAGAIAGLGFSLPAAADGERSTELALTSAEGAIVLAQRTRQRGSCPAHYSKTRTRDEGKELVYECVRIMGCADEYKAEEYEVIDDEGRIIHKYRCVTRDKSEYIQIDHESS